MHQVSVFKYKGSSEKFFLTYICIIANHLSSLGAKEWLQPQRDLQSIVAAMC